MDFEKICMMFSMEEPYYGIILSSMNRVPTPTLDTLGVGKTGNVFTLYYNPNFVDNLPVDTVLQLLKHECMHVAFNHFTMWDDDDHVERYERFMRNCAQDFEINGYLDRNKIAKEAGGLFPEDMGWDSFLGTREYYSRLKQKDQQQQAQAKNPTKPCNGGQGGQQGQPQKGQGQNQGQQQQQSGSSGNSGNSADSGSQSAGNGNSSNGGNNGNGDDLSDFEKELLESRFDDHSLWPKDMTEAEKELLKQAVDELVAFAADECEKACGDIPGELKGRIEAIRQKKRPRPVADWKRYFRRYVGNEFTEFIRKSKKRESRRFPDAAGNRHRRKSNILVAIDTSGSVSMPEYLEFMGQLRTLSDTSNFHVIECDAKIQFEYDYKGRPNETLHGGGGTSFCPVIDRFLREKGRYEALVYFTDGYCYIPNNTPRETLWVISSKGDKDRNKYKVNGAKVVFIPDRQQ